MINTSAVRHGYTAYWHDEPISPNHSARREAEQQFDEWLLAVQAAAWEAGYQARGTQQFYPAPPAINPHLPKEA